MNVCRRIAVTGALVRALLLAPAVHAGPAALPALQADLSQTTVSGLSSGAFMAGQFAVAYSGSVAGVGIVAGGPYYCAGYPGVPPFIPYLTNAMTECENPTESGVAPPDAAALWSRARGFARDGLIDDPENLKRQKVYLYSGTADHTVTRETVDQTRRFYELAGVPSANILYVDNVASGHGMITDRPSDNACDVTGPPYFNNCGVRQAQDILRQLYGALNAPASHAGGKILRFNQRAFAQATASMSPAGYAYIPAACASASCRVHVAFHGCLQGVAAIGDHFYAHAGYNELADTNRIIVLYPQLEPSYVYPYNPKGCWDFWGYTSADPGAPDFYTRNGAQAQAVFKMLARLGQARAAAKR